MGRLPSADGCHDCHHSFRFLPHERAKMEKIRKECKDSIPPENILLSLVKKFSRTREQCGRFTVERKQVVQWFRNRRWCERKKQAVEKAEKLPDKSLQSAEASSTATLSDELDITKMEFEAKSSKDGAWYDVQMFVAHRILHSGESEVRARFTGYGADDDEWVNVKTAVRQRSVPCEASECISVQPGDLVLCFLEGNRQALYYDAHVVDIERRRHDIRGCRCRFVVQYKHDGSMGVLPLRRLCRRPKTEDRSAKSAEDFSGAAITDSSKLNSELCNQ